MRGVVPAVETVLLAAAIVIFMVYLVDALNDFVDRVSTERAKAAMEIDAQKAINTILLARREIGQGSAKFYIDLSDIPYEMKVSGGNLVLKSRNARVNATLFGMDAYVTFQGKIVNAKGQRPYIYSSGNSITLGVE